MKRIIFTTLLIIAAATAAFAQVKVKPNLPVTKDLVETLKASGSYKTLIIVIGKVGLDALGLGKNSKEEITLFAPTNAAFAKLPKAELDALMKDKQKMKNLLLAHAVKGKITVADLLVPTGEGMKTYKELKSLEGRVLGFECDGHTGEHHPRVNGGAAIIGKGDVAFDRGIIHEVDNVLAQAGPGGGPRSF